jgi:hypothetical protein
MDVVVRNGADGILTGGLESRDLEHWFDANYIGRVNNGDGQTSSMSFGTSILPGDTKAFLRLNIKEAP